MNNEILSSKDRVVTELDEEKKEKENKRKKEKELCEYQKLQYEQRKRQGLDDFIKLNADNNMDKSGISSMRNNDVTRISELHKNQHGSMSSLYQ